MAEESSPLSESKGSRSSVLVLLVVLGLGVVATLFEVLFLDQCLLSIDNRLFPPFGVHLPADTPPRPMNVMTVDINGFVMPETFVQVERLKAGEWPLWNDRQNLGQPLWADMGFAVCTPTVLLYLLADPLVAHAWSMALHLMLLGLGAGLLLRRLGQGPQEALLGAVVIAFCAFLIVRLHIPNFVRVAAWIPWLWWSGDRLLERPGAGRIAAVGAFLGLALLAGFPQMAFLGLYAAAAWWLLRIATQRSGGRGRGLVAGGLAIGLGGALSAILLLPGAELYEESWRGQVSDEQTFESKALQAPSLVQVVLPFFFGTPVQELGPADPPRRWEEFPSHREWLAGEPVDIQNNFVENCLHVGRIPLLLALIGLFGALGRGRRRGDLFFVGLLAISLAFAMGAPWLSDGLRRLPGLATGNPKRALFLSTLALAWLCASGWSRLRQTRGFALVPGGLVLVGLGVLAFLPFEGWLFPDEVAARRGWFREVVGPDLMGAGLAGLIALGAAGLLRAGKTRLCFGVLLLASLGEAVVFSRTVNPPIDRADQFTATPVIEELRARGAADDWRVITFGRQEVLGASMAQVFGLRCANGISAMADADTGALLHALDPEIIDPRDPRLVSHLRRPERVSAPLLDVLGVRYVAANVDASGAVAEVPTLDQVYWNPAEGVSLVERSTALPSAFFVRGVEGVPDADERLRRLVDPAFPGRELALLEDPGRALEEVAAGEVLSLDRVSPERLELKLRTEGRAFLVFSESSHPGWTASLDGSEVEVLRVDHALMGVWVPEGAEDLVFEYRPRSFRHGLWISAIAALVLLALSVRALLSRRAVRP